MIKVVLGAVCAVWLLYSGSMLLEGVFDGFRGVTDLIDYAVDEAKGR